MQVNTVYLIECAIYEKCISGSNTGNCLPEFYRTNPDVFLESVVITPEIEELDGKREAVMRILQAMYESGIDREDPRYTDTIDFGWDVYRNEVTRFYEANKTKLDNLINQYETYASHMR